MKLNLSSQIVLNKVPEQYYRPRTAVERSEITRCEKIFTDIYPKVEEAAAVIANTVEAEIKRAKDAGRSACSLWVQVCRSHQYTPSLSVAIRSAA